jgi:hypothetical protein
LTAAVSSVTAAAAEYRHFAYPGADFAFDYPGGWTLSPGLQAANFTHADGREASVRIGGYPLGRDDPATAGDYVARTLANMKLFDGRLDRQETIQVSGRDATRLEFVDKHGSWGQAASVAAVVPNGAQYFVLTLYGKVADVAALRPEFDRLVASFRPGPASGFLREWAGSDDGPSEARRMVARTPAELQGMIRVFGPQVQRLVPDGGIDFNRYLLVGISLGRKPSGGYSVSIEDAAERDGVLYLRYREHSPAPTSVETQAFTSAYHLKLLPASKAATVKFERVCEPEISDPDPSQ